MKAIKPDIFKTYIPPKTEEGIACVKNIKREKSSCDSQAFYKKTQCLEDARQQGAEDHRRALESYDEDVKKAEQEYQYKMELWRKEAERRKDAFDRCKQQQAKAAQDSHLVDYDWAVRHYCGRYRNPPPKPIDFRDQRRPSIDEFTDEKWCMEQYREAKKHCKEQYDSGYQICGGEIK